MRGGCVPRPSSQDCHARPGLVPAPSLQRLFAPETSAGPHWAIVEMGRICQPLDLGIPLGATRPRCFPYEEAGSHRGKDPEQ